VTAIAYLSKERAKPSKGWGALLDECERAGHNDAVLHHRFRKILPLALLLALSLPTMVTVAIAVHEAAHHRHGARTGEYLFAVVHGHHHDQEIEEHDHEAVVKMRAGSMAERLVALSMRSDRCMDASLGTVRSAGDGPLLEPPRSSDFCIWLL